MDVKFKKGFHGDLILGTGGNLFNLGYNNWTDLTIVPWLYYRQRTGGNIFCDYDVQEDIEIGRNIDYSFDVGLDELVDFYRRLPFSSNEFNYGVKLLGLESFFSGNNRVSNGWVLLDNGLLSLYKSGSDDEFVDILVGDELFFKDFCYSYCDFVFSGFGDSVISSNLSLRISELKNVF